MWNISFILDGRVKWGLLNRIVEKLLGRVDISSIILHTTMLTDVKVRDRALFIREKYIDIDLIVKELNRGDLLGGILSTMQLLDTGSFIIVDMRIIKNSEWVDKLPLDKETVIFLTRKGRRGFRLDVEISNDGYIKIIPYRGGKSFRFGGVFLYGERFINHVKKLLLLYYNPDFLKFENVLDSYIYRVGDIYGYIID